jgi:methionine synthase I (cobalamin-dependent)
MSAQLINNNPFDKSGINFRPLILDGAMGSYLQEKGFAPNHVLWMTNLNQNNPEVIIQVHEDYITAGADLITTNTFRTNPSALDNYGIKDYKVYVKQAVKLGQKAVGNRDVLIAGSNAPAEDCYQRVRTLSQQKLEVNHINHIDLLIDSGVNIILNETQSHFDEIQIICEHCSKNKIPFVISLYIEEPMNILSGESLESVLFFISDYNPLAIGFNCISPKLFRRILEQVTLSFNWGFYLNCGSGNIRNEVITCDISPDEYLESVKESFSSQPSFVGSCCGSNPDHIKKIKELLDGKD